MFLSMKTRKGHLQFNHLGDSDQRASATDTNNLINFGNEHLKCKLLLKDMYSMDFTIISVARVSA